jgi:hypothetical protein
VVIDFIQIVFKTVENTNAFSIKRNTGISYVEPLNKGDGAAASEFQFRLYDVTNWNQYDDCIKKLKEHYALDGNPVISGIEISLDAYSKSLNSDELIEHVIQFCWNLANPVNGNRRFFGGQMTKAEDLQSRSRMIEIIKRTGGTIYIGSQNEYKDNPRDSESMRIYPKTTDKNKPLSPLYQRARIEITLMDEACPFKTIEEARNFDFTTIIKYFRFRNYVDNLEGIDKIIVNATPTISEKRKRKRIGGGIREHSRLTVADTELNRIVYDRFRNLNRDLNT